MKYTEKCSFWLRIKAKLGFKLTCNERGIHDRWLTRNVTESIEETLKHLHAGDYGDDSFYADEDFG